MGAKMSKKNVIYGSDTSRVKVTEVNWPDVKLAIERMVGPDARIELKEAKLNVAQGKKDKRKDQVYVKVGLVKNDLVLRVKRSLKSGDVETDSIVVRGAKKLAKAHAEQVASDTAARLAEQDRLKSLPATDQAAIVLDHRIAMIELQRDFAVRMEDHLQTVRAHATQIEDLSRSADLTSKHGRDGYAHRVTEEAKAASALIKEVQREYKHVTKSGGPLMRARGDHTFKDEKSLDPVWLKQWKAEFNRAFSEGDVFMIRANEAIDEMKDLVREIRAARDEAANDVALRDPVMALKRLDSIRNDLDRLSAGARTRAEKTEGAVQAEQGLWSHLFREPMVVPAEAVKKQFAQQIPTWRKLFEGLPKGLDRLVAIERSMRSFPPVVLEDQDVQRELDDLHTLVQATRTVIEAAIDRRGAFEDLASRGQAIIDALD